MDKTAINFPRGSIKDPKGKNKSKQFYRQNFRNSMYENNRMSGLKKDGGELTNDEKTLIYYLVNLILFKQFNMANSLIKKHYIPMKKCSVIFKANMRRLRALSLYQSIVDHEVKKMSSIDHENGEK